MSKLTCHGCGAETSECPDDFPPEWKGYCPHCAVAKMFTGELPRCTPEVLASIVVGGLILEVEVVDKKKQDLDMSFTGTGQIMFYHKPELCEGQFCPMHNPSEHHMRTWLMHGRSDLKLPIIDRICPHNALHPDPDSLAWALRHDPEFEWYHGACDGCCHDG